MTKSNKFSPEVRERAVRMVQEHRGEYPSLWAAIESIAPQIGCVPQTLNEWVKRAEVDAGVREGVTNIAIRTGTSRSAKSCRSPRQRIGTMPPCCVNLTSAANGLAEMMFCSLRLNVSGGPTCRSMASRRSGGHWLAKA